MELEFFAALVLAYKFFAFIVIAFVAFASIVGPVALCGMFDSGWPLVLWLLAPLICTVCYKLACLL